MTERLLLDYDAPDIDVIARAAGVLRDGGLVAFPTETVYGLGVHAMDAAAVRRLFAAKGRPANDPLIVHVADASRILQVAASVPRIAAALADRFWPGPLTLVVPRADAVPREVTAGGDTVAVRVPSHPVAQALLRAADVPVAAPSANLFSRPSPTCADHVLADLDGRIDLVLDAGPTSVGVESTVLDLTVSPPRVLRPGAVTVEMLRGLIPDVAGLEDDAGLASGAVAHSPGLLEKHYSPRAPLTCYEGPANERRKRMLADARQLTATQRVGILTTRDDAAAFQRIGAALVVELGDEADTVAIAARLYAALRELDAADVEVILATGPSSGAGLNAAVRDRLHRAAAGRVVRT